MLGNREMKMDDYLAALRRRKWIVLVLTLLGPVVGIAIARILTPSYTSESLVLVEEQHVPESFVRPIISEDVVSRLRSMQEQVLSRSRLQALIERFGLFKDERPITQTVVDGMRENTSVTILLDFLNQTKKKKSIWDSLLGMFSSKGEEKGGEGATPQYIPRKDSQPVTGFTVDFTYEDPHVAQQVCAEITSMFLEENLRERQQDAQGTTDFLSAQVTEAKGKLDEQDAKLAAFKRRYLGALPEEQQSNLQVLGTLNTQLSAVTDQLGRAEQDKAYSESLLAQQLAELKASQQTGEGTEGGLIERQLIDLRQKAVLLEGHYTSDYPDLIKTKREIAQLEKQAVDEAAANSKSAKPLPAEKEPPQIQQLRAQLQQDEEQIRIKVKDQERLQNQIKLYESRVQLTPAVEQEYKQLTRDYRTALDFYNDLLNKRDQSAMASDMERRQQGEQFIVLDSANLPVIPSFPDPVLFLLGGLGGGLGVGLTVAVALELADKVIRIERDVESLLGIPALAMIPPLVAKKRKANHRVGAAGLAEKQPAVGV
jgi:polysaccharide chain length determinant protein (PEP-CTERM system associated)